MLEQITFNLSSSCRHAKLKGVEYLVVPMVMLTEGVHNGSNGPLYYPEDELKKTPAVWNTKPIVVYHPTQNGNGISACDPDVLEKSSVGMIMNTKFKKARGSVGKLHAEAWLEITRLEEVDPRILETLEADMPMELSTGVFTDNDETPGTWNGEDYVAVARNYRPDHLALLPDMVGACSIADGAGFLRLNSKNAPEDAQKRRKLAAAVVRAHNAAGVVLNGMSYGTVTSLLSAEVRAAHATGEKEYAWVEDVYDDYVVYMYENSDRMGLYKQAYTVVEGQVSLVGDPYEVRRETKYVAVMKVTENNAPQETSKEDTVDKKAYVDGLIANKVTAWGEDDREFLMKQDETALKKFAPVENNATPPATAAGASDPALVAAAARAGAEGGGATPPTPPAANAAPKTMEQYITEAPAEYRGLLRNSLHQYNARRQELVSEITANENNKFAPEFLATKEVDELEALAALARRPDPATLGGPQMFRAPNYAGAAGGAPTGNKAHTEAPLGIPAMNFEKATA